MGKANKPFVDYYELLGISQEATAEEIKSAYREKALEHHPDQNPDADSHKAFVALHEAYRVLNDAQARSRYDYRYFSQKSNRSKEAGLAQRRELTRAKRSARYSRRMYSPRMRYRSSYSGPSRPAPRPSPRPQTPPDPSRTEKSDRKILDEHEASLLGFRYYNRVVRFILVGVLMFSLGMVGDYFTAVQTSEETLTSKEPVMWTLGTPNMVKIKSVFSSAVIPKGEAKWIEPGGKFIPYKTLFAGEVTK
ncbi:MAG: DnaJ domain-containing protein, partial [Bacteroidota bacterium]